MTTINLKILTRGIIPTSLSIGSSDDILLTKQGDFLLKKQQEVWRFNTTQKNVQHEMFLPSNKKLENKDQLS